MPTTNSALAAVAMAAVLVLAGCAGSLPGGTNGTATDAAGEDPANVDVGSNSGTVEFYVSDEQNAIDDFAHLNVTITKVGLHRVGDAGGDDAAATESATATSNATEVATETATPSVTPTATATEAEAEDEEEAEGQEGEGDAKWVEYTVNRTVDLTELQGANATKLGVLEAPDGEYDKVFVYVSDIHATLKNGETVNVKLPSSKLHINKGFTLGDGQNVSFVFDISVHKAGKSGKYILKPVVSQSGTGDEVDIEDVDEKDEEDETDEDETDDDEQETEEPETEETEATEAEEDEQGEGNGEGNGNNPSVHAPL